MSDNIVSLDLFIQDFISTNIVMNQHIDWTTLVNRRFLEDGLVKVFKFVSNSTTHFAIAKHLALPDGDWLRIELTHSIPQLQHQQQEKEQHRFDYLRMLLSTTHNNITVEEINSLTLLVKLTTRHCGIVNVVFVISDKKMITDPFSV